MRRTAVAMMSVAALLVVLAAPALAHNLEVRNPNTGDLVKEVWIGGFILPAPAQEAPPMFGPFNLPPSHGRGLVAACHGTANSPGVAILAPPFFTGCVHGQP
jgi:hypothetical protein